MNQNNSSLVDPRLLDFFNKIISFAFWFFFVLLLFMLLYFALKYILGGKEDISEVHSRIKPVLIAIIIVFFAFTIPIIIRSFFSTFFGS